MKASFAAATICIACGLLLAGTWLSSAHPAAAAPAAVVTPGTEVPTPADTATPAPTATSAPAPTSTTAPTDTPEPEPRRAKLGVEKNASGGELVVGGLLTYRIRVYNDGDAPARDVVVTDSLPANLAYVSATAPRGAISVNGNEVSVDLDTLGGGSEIEITIVTRPLAAGEVRNTVVVSTSSSTDRPEDNLSEATVLIRGGPLTPTPALDVTPTIETSPTPAATPAGALPTPAVAQAAPPAAQLPGTGGEEGPAALMLLAAMGCLLAGAYLGLARGKG